MIEADLELWVFSSSVKRQKQGHCWECGVFGPVHDHHVVPKIKGGKRTVPLCELHHGLVHDLSYLDHAHLTRIGLERAKAKGIALGRPGGSKFSESLLDGFAESGKSIRRFAKDIGVTEIAIRRLLKRQAAALLRQE